MSQGTQNKSQNSDLYDNLAKVVVKAKQEGFSSSQVNSFLEYSQSTTDKNELFVFIMRQAERGKYTETARLMLSYLKDKDMSEIRKFIGLLKWLMDAIENVNVPSNINNFESLIDLYIKNVNSNSGYSGHSKYQGGSHGYSRS